MTKVEAVFWIPCKHRSTFKALCKSDQQALRAQTCWWINFLTFSECDLYHFIITC